MIAEGLNKKIFRETLIAVSSSVTEFLCSLIKVSYLVQGTPSATATPSLVSVLFLPEESLKQVALSLIHCISSPIFELAYPGIMAIATLAQRDNGGLALGEEVDTSSKPIMLLYSKAVNFLLTNAMLRRLEEPNAFAVTSRYKIYSPGKGREKTSGKRKGQGKGVMQVLVELDEEDNLELASLRIVDACLNALIDLHSSDDTEYLDNFRRMNCLQKLQASFHAFGKR